MLGDLGRIRPFKNNVRFGVKLGLSVRIRWVFWQNLTGLLAELADARLRGGRAFGRGGSSPPETITIMKQLDKNQRYSLGKFFGNVSLLIIAMMLGNEWFTKSPLSSRFFFASSAT